MHTNRFLVTGGAGVIGSTLVDERLQQRQAVRVLDTFSTGKREHRTPFRDEGDRWSDPIVRQAVAGVDIILHQAALPSVPRSTGDPITTSEVNVTGTLHLLEAAREAGVRRVVYASSSSIYGNGPERPKHERMTPNPLSPYAVSKLAGETSPSSTGWRRWRCATSTSSPPGRTRIRKTNTQARAVRGPYQGTSC